MYTVERIDPSPTAMIVVDMENDFVAPGVDWCNQCPGQASDRAGLKQYLTDLHHASPETRLVVDQVVGGLLETVTVRVHVSGFPIAGTAVPWGPVDALPPAVTGVALARLTFAVDSGMEGLLSAGPTLIVVESGALWVRIAYSGTILRASGQIESAGNAGTPVAVIETILHQGDGAIVPAAVGHALRQDGPEPAVVVGTTLAFEEDERSRPRHPALGVFEPSARASQGPSSIFPAIRMLVREEVAEWSPSPVRVALGRMVLSPGARVVLADGGTLFVAVEAGTLELAGKNGRTVAAGVGVMEPEGPDRTLRNAGAGLLVLLVLTITPVAESNVVL